MPQIKMFSYKCFVTVKLSSDLGVEAKQFSYQLKLNVIDSSQVADRVKSMVLHSPNIRNRHDEIINIHIMVVDEKNDYEHTELNSVRIDDVIFETEVNSYPLNGLSYCSLDDDFFINAQLECKRDSCEGCHKKKRVCVL